MRTALRQVLLLGLLVCVPHVAEGTPITFDFAGEITISDLIDLPVGTPVTVSWSFDDAEPNGCGDRGFGFYRNQSAVITLGDWTYTATGYFYTGRITAGCDTVGWTDRELRLFSWTGPDLPHARLYPGSGSSAPGLFWMDPVWSSSLPTSPPDLASFGGPIFQQDGLPAGLRADVHPVPGTGNTRARRPGAR
jgi:hypothetical protein